MEHANRGHSVIGASSASRWMECPASVKLSEGIVEAPSPYAAEGTCAHELAEAALEDKDHDCKKFIGVSFNGVQVSAEMADYTQIYVDYVLEEAKEGDLLIEEQFDLEHIYPGMFGTNDACVIKHDSISVIDLKYGKGSIVDAEENPQLMYYALGAVPDLSDIASVKLVIVQPRVDEPIKEHVISASRLEKFAKELKAKAKRVFSEDPEIKTGDHCKFCKAKAICPKMRSEVMETVGTAFDTTPVEEFNLPDVSALSMDQITKILERKVQVTKWLDSIYAHAMDLASKGEKIPGYKLVKRRTQRKITDEFSVMEQFEETHGDAIYAPKKLKSVAQLEKVVGKKELEEFVTKPDKGEELVHATDKRDEVNVKTIEDHFSEPSESEMNFNDMEF